MRSVSEASFTRANLINANLSKTDLMRANLTGVNLSEAIYYSEIILPANSDRYFKPLELKSIAPICPTFVIELRCFCVGVARRRHRLIKFLTIFFSKVDRARFHF